MECTMSQPVIRLMPLLFAALVLFPACSPEPQEVHAITEFDVGYRPSANIQQQVEVLLATGSGSSNSPVYSDIAFFPVIRADAFDLGELPAALRRGDVEPDLSGIDFDSHFGFLVAHPNATKSYGAMMSGQRATYFSSVRVSYPEDRVLIHLSGSRLGGLDPMTALTARWEGSVYPIERRGRTDVEVRIDENAYMYSLEDGGLEASATKGKP